MEMVKVFLTDDDADDRRYVCKSFAAAGCADQLEEFDNGQQLIEALQEDRIPQCILLDMDMPIIDGYEVLEFLGSAGPKFGEISVFVMTSSDVHEDILRERGCSPTAFIRKPVSYESFRTLFDRYA